MMHLRTAIPVTPAARSCSRQRGFTLLEIMVALVLIAVGMAAVMTTITTNIHNTAGLKQRTFAHWVAMNTLAELHISKKWPIRNDDGDMLMANHEWHWELKTKKPKQLPKELRSNIQEVEIRVFANEKDENSIVTLSTYITKPVS
jgi:general secretion pathway protein I